jgi:8-amino-7-oxononanoate synthase
MTTQQRFVARLADGLAARETAGLRRSLALPAGIDVTSNDYLGYAADAELAALTADYVRAHGTGAGAARLLRGHLPGHAALEAALATFCQRDAALLFSSGWAANTGLWPALAGQGDWIFSHRANHASSIDGMRLSKAQRMLFHDTAELAHLLQQPRTGQAFVALESVQSMSGQLSDLAAICQLAAAHDALVVVDEAHATGLYGPDGAGRVAELHLQNQVLCTLHTAGKALGVSGAWLAGPRPLIEHLQNHARSFVYSTAVAPAMLGGLLAVLPRLQRDAAIVAELHDKAAWLRATLAAAGLDLDGSTSCIVPVLLGTPERALAIAQQLREDGFDVRAVRPPTVPQGTSRLRLVVRTALGQAELQRLAERVIQHTRP